MTTNFKPQAGMLFYARCKDKRDKSWTDYVFRCVASDDNVVVASIASGYPMFDQGLFDTDTYTFAPVGPEVAKALGLEIAA